MLRKLSLVVSLLRFVPLISVGCFPYVYHEQESVLVTGIDVDATLEVARIELEEGGFDSTLTIWAMRDQVVTADHAKKISELYFRYIDKVAAEEDRVTADFGVWHFAWAISNLYRNGDGNVKAELEGAYLDARKRPAGLENFEDIASEHVNGSKIYMGDIHATARSYAHSHIVAPGNAEYLQSLEQYKKHEEEEA